jgi:hypothetical protein
VSQYLGEMINLIFQEKLPFSHPVTLVASNFHIRNPSPVETRPFSRVTDFYNKGQNRREVSQVTMTVG